MAGQEDVVVVEEGEVITSCELNADEADDEALLKAAFATDAHVDSADIDDDYLDGAGYGALGGDAGQGMLRYGVRDHKGDLVSEAAATYRWYVLNEQTQFAELAEVGLDAPPASLRSCRLRQRAARGCAGTDEPGRAGIACEIHSSGCQCRRRSIPS